MTNTNAMNTQDRLQAAVDLGLRIGMIRADWRLWRLSRAAWTDQAMKLGNFTRSVDATMEQVRRYPALCSEIETRAILWVRNEQDRVGVWSGFGSHGDPVVYAELLAAGIAPEGASALAALRVVELRDVSWWGVSAGLDPPDGDAALHDLVAELAVLDRQLAAVHSGAYSFRADGWPVLEHAGIEVPFNATNASRMASAFADEAGRLAAVAEPLVAVAA